MQRKTVTVLFCDLAGSTALGETTDPERLQTLLARYFERMKSIVERHGGTVEKFIGDAVMAVFGVPVLHEDDALRAVRAAAEMRDALPELGLNARIGVTTGEVVTGTEERLATGDAVNVAARLEQAAQPGEVLIGEPTLALVRDAAEVVPVEPLTLKGKSQPVAAFRLLRVRDGVERAHDTRFVGRGRELAALREAWDRALRDRACELVTIVGDPGVGKSRLAAELVASLDAAVAQGRCVPYGEGITYWPVVEILKQLNRLPPDPAAAVAIRSLLGEGTAATSADEIAWAFRKTLEHAASERPQVVVFDDIHWGEETFLDLLEHVALFSSDAPILLLCLGRAQLMERRPTWPTPLRLDPLAPADVDELMPDTLPAELRERIGRAAAGNPLFVNEMLAMASDARGDVVVPPTLQALLAARLDQLEAPERSVLERGAVEGEVFHRGAVQALASDGTQVMPRLASLVRKELIRPHRAQVPGDDGFRFRHLLIRDAAYDALPKAVRADLHERFARWLEHHASQLVELDEIVGYHLEQACRYRVELGLPLDDQVAADARRRLTLAGRRAYVRSDASVPFFERAMALVPSDEIDLALETDLIEGLYYWGSQPEQALTRAASLVERGAASGNRVAELVGSIEREVVLSSLEPEGASPRLKALLDEAIPLFHEAEDDVALYRAYYSLGKLGNHYARLDAALDAYDRAAVYAARAGLPYPFTAWRASARMYGTTPASEVLAWLDGLEPAPLLSPYLQRYRAEALARLGRVDEARAALSQALADLEDRGGGIALANLWCMAGIQVELLGDDPAAAVAYGEEGCRLFEELGEKAFLSTASALLALAYVELGQFNEAESWALRGNQVGASDDAVTQILWRQARAKVLARRGRHLEAGRLAYEAVAIADATDLLESQGDASADLADVLVHAGRVDEAVAALERAIDCYDRKENVVAARRARKRLAELTAAA